MPHIPRLIKRIIRIQPAPISSLGETLDKPSVSSVPDTLQTIEKNLTHSDPLIRAVSIELASRLGHKKAINQIIILLKDPLHIIRQKAAMALGKLGAKKAVGNLIELLSDESEEVRITAAGVLGLLKDKEAVPALILALQDRNPQIKMKAAVSLGLIGDKRAVPFLAQQLKDPNELVRKYAIEALGNIGRPAIPVLLDAMSDENVRAQAMEVLMKIR